MSEEQQQVEPQQFDMDQGQYLQQQQQQDSHQPEYQQPDSALEQGLMADQSNHIGYYRQEEDSPQSYNSQLDESFEKNPDMFAKAKANLLTMINDHRSKQNLGILFEDITLNNIANQMSIYLKDNDYSHKHLKQLMDYQRIDFNPQIAHIVSRYDQVSQHSKQDSLEYFIQIGYLFFQIQNYKRYLQDPSINHIGIGLAGNKRHIVIVYLFSSKALTISHISYSPQTQRVDIKGKMLDTSVGVYVVKLINGNAPPDQKTYMQLVLPNKMTYSKVTKQFTVWLQCANPFKTRHFIQIYTRANPDSISYGKQNGSKLDFKYFDMKMRALLIQFPDSNFKHAMDIINEEKRKQLKQQQNEVQIVQQVNIPQQVIPLQSQQEPSEGQIIKTQSQSDIKQQTATNKQIREQLQTAIAQAKRQKIFLKQLNDDFVQRIKNLKVKPPQMYVQRGGQMAMNQHKYLNTLTQVHQTRLDLKQTHQKYSKMYADLQQKMKQKKQKCNQIRGAFNDLKKEIARKAAYSRTDKPIQEKKIQQWQDGMQNLNKKLEQCRLQILKYRNTLAKNQKFLKKKDELADGLHLIDFEQLKIQNQALNERIQQRNQDLHKLKKKTNTTVQIFTHTKQKYNFICKQYKQKKEVLQKKQEIYKQCKEDLRKLKKDYQQLRVQFKKAKQNTQIVNSQELVEDYRKRTKRISNLQQQITNLSQQQNQMKQVIDAYQRKIKKASLQK